MTTVVVVVIVVVFAVVVDLYFVQQIMLFVSK